MPQRPELFGILLWTILILSFIYNSFIIQPSEIYSVSYYSLACSPAVCLPSTPLLFSLFLRVHVVFNPFLVALMRFEEWVTLDICSVCYLYPETGVCAF